MLFFNDAAAATAGAEPAYDLSQIAIPVDRVEKGLVKKSLRWNPVNIGRFVIFFGPLSSFFELTKFAIVW